jgi:hypothetical protein
LATGACFLFRFHLPPRYFERIFGQQFWFCTENTKETENTSVRKAMFRSHLARALVIASLGLNCGCLCCDRPLFPRLHGDSCCSPSCGGGCGGGCCGEIAGFQDGGMMMEGGGPMLTPGTVSVPGGCGTLVPQGQPLPLTTPPGVRIEPRPAPTEPYRAPMP